MLHDWITIEPEVNKGILKSSNDDIHVGIVKAMGPGYCGDSGYFVNIEGINEGDRILFTQHLTYEVDGKKLYRTRYRDVIEVLGA